MSNEPNRTRTLVGMTADGLSSIVRRLVCEEGEAAEIRIAFDADPGLYQLSVIADASGFDWESLYVDLFAYGNSGQRTGPWDFHPTDGARALLPSYWAELDGRKLGLWHFQRVSVDDMRHQRFRGRLAFYAHAAGPHRLTLRPYRPAAVEWTSVLLEADPDDAIGDGAEAPSGWFDRCPFAAWRKPSFREELAAKLEGTHRLYAEPLRLVFAWLDDPRSRKPQTIPLRVAKALLTRDDSSLAHVTDWIDRTVRAEHWGNPNPDGYGHDGDMGAMYAMWSLVFAYHALFDMLDEERKRAIVRKLTVQGSRFFDKILLYRDYWGGSVLQDHGWRSMFGFGSAALHLLGVIPEAELWVSYLVPRLERSLAAMPTDGVIPASSHYTLHLYTDMLGHYRDALLGWTGRDLYADGKFPRIVDYLAATLHEPEMMLVGRGRDKIHLVGGNSFLNAMASVHGDRRAAYIQKRLLDNRLDAFYAEPEELAYYSSVLWGLLSYDGTAEPAERLERQAVMHVWEDSGVVHYRDPDGEVVLSLRVGPPMGHTAYRRTDGPCDRLGLGPDAGHFMLAVKGRPLLVTPDGGYRLTTGIRTCLLVDGRGQLDDVGYPMSVPSCRYAGEDLRTVRWNPANGRGQIRLDLAPSYPEDAGISSYTREFAVEKGKPIRMRDHIVLDEARKLTWLFQTKRANGLRLDGMRILLGEATERSDGAGITGEGGLILAVHTCPELALTVSVEEAPVVWSYVSTNDFQPFDTVRYETAEPVRAVAVDFLFAPIG
ncbi:MAG: hypothetical protein K0R28_183 [Paenibacillus sp.]|nr:hypothetical protein [Paenibacillus sp.]